jgi:hypothetical protein
LPAIVGRDGHRINAAPGSGHVVKIPLPDGAAALSLDAFALLVRYLPDSQRQDVTKVARPAA